MTDGLSIWTIYDHPKDYPAGFVARMFRVDASGVHVTQNTIYTEDLDTLRTILLTEMQLTCLQRHPNDDACIVECWL